MLKNEFTANIQRVIGSDIQQQTEKIKKSQLNKNQLSIPSKINVQVLATWLNKVYRACIDRNFHKKIEDFMAYLAQIIPVTKYSVLVNVTDSSHILTHLDAVVDGDLLILKMKDEQWTPPPELLPSYIFMDSQQKQILKTSHQTNFDGEQYSTNTPFYLKIQDLLGKELFK